VKRKSKSSSHDSQTIQRSLENPGFYIAYGHKIFLWFKLKFTDLHAGASAIAYRMNVIALVKDVENTRGRFMARPRSLVKFNRIDRILLPARTCALRVLMARTYDMPRWSPDSAKFEISHVFALNRKLKLTLRDLHRDHACLPIFPINNAESKRKYICGRKTAFSHGRYPRRGSGPHSRRL